MRKSAIVLILLTFLISGCKVQEKQYINNKVPENRTNHILNKEQSQNKKQKDNMTNLKSNQMGKIMILMYHRFTEKETDDWTRSFDNFKNDLQILYDKGYRPINLRDYIDGKIDISAGYTPVVFTFDDGTAGQFNLIEKEGMLVANPKSAVGIMEEFNKTHPDFRLKGTFFINYTSFFSGKGTSEQKLKYLTDKGFEIGNHTMSHINLKKAASPEIIQQEIGGHTKKTSELMPNYMVDELALPLGISSKKFEQYVVEGEYKGLKYKNRAIMLVGSNPALSPFDKNRNLLRLPRIRARGKISIENDMYYWLNYFDKNPEQRFVL
ncbi:MAG: polysaccharide deacetylase family protein [Deltaproteobacteria bacterium]